MKEYDPGDWISAELEKESTNQEDTTYNNRKMLLNLQGDFDALIRKVETLEKTVIKLTNEQVMTNAITKELSKEALKRSYKEEDLKEALPLEKCRNEEIAFLYGKRDTHKKLLEDKGESINCLKQEVTRLQKENQFLIIEISRQKALQHLVDKLKPITDQISATVAFNERLKELGVQSSLSKVEEKPHEKQMEEWANKMKGLEF